MYDLYSPRHSHYSLDAFQPTFALHSSSHLSSLHVTQPCLSCFVDIQLSLCPTAQPRLHVLPFRPPAWSTLLKSALGRRQAHRLSRPSARRFTAAYRSPSSLRYLAAALAAHYLCIYRIDLHCHPSIFRPHPSIAALSLVTARYIHTPHHPHPSTAISINIYSTSAHAHPPALTHLHTALIVKIAFDRTYKSSPFHAPLAPLGYHPLPKYTLVPLRPSLGTVWFAPSV